MFSSRPHSAYPKHHPAIFGQLLIWLLVLLAPLPARADDCSSGTGVNSLGKPVCNSGASIEAIAIGAAFGALVLLIIGFALYRYLQRRKSQPKTPAQSDPQV
ncbi:uncharacterized protein BJ171DRAFT_490857 [Polychytrium aggregatum]|uniref:uncharacterized protein n=1 Tax=Polychytrium aggregatum TaxID=110093 RepID=UPI0022FEB1A9|nr:uncharacterized protein BJ171DRAFT_490857 [Polychytrium aggregatum]KAI9208277.1 hypothetical protein BJ171DRAFT_490857 [Polychytrium aggregatum]